MKVINTIFPDLKVIEPVLHRDNRGLFFENYNRASFSQYMGFEVDFVQENYSRSIKGVVRGLHYQLKPHSQAKLVQCIAGEVYDVTVDVRTSSSTFGQWFGVFLSSENKRQIWIPEGFAHGFLTLSDYSEFLYKTTDYWSKECERAIRWDDPQIGIEWPDCGVVPLLSEKDQFAPILADQKDLFD